MPSAPARSPQCNDSWRQEPTCTERTACTRPPLSSGRSTSSGRAGAARPSTSKAEDRGPNSTPKSRPIFARARRLPLRRAGPAHDGPYVHDLIAADDVIAVVDGGAHVELGGIDLDALAEFHVASGVGPAEESVFGAL